MALVDYESSEPEDSDSEVQAAASKKRKLDSIHHEKQSSKLPPLPSTFQDLYSSTVRTSTQDDPSLHAGRKRVIPHVEGNWPTHVYLDWRLRHQEADHLSKIVETAQSSATKAGGQNTVTSLLQNDLGVSLPLHVSLSRPLVLLTPQREPFLEKLKHAIRSSTISEFKVKPGDVVWHPNENSTRWFLVLRLQPPDNYELNKLLLTCNDVAASFNQPKLYASHSEASSAIDFSEDGRPSEEDEASGQFHVSLAWSLSPQQSSSSTLPLSLEQESDMEILFNEVKVRIGQDVHTIALPARRLSVAGLTRERDSAR